MDSQLPGIARLRPRRTQMLPEREHYKGRNHFFGGTMQQDKLLRAWITSGSPPLEDLGAILGVGYIELLRIMQGGRARSEGIKQALASAFNKPVEELFGQE
jgi:hypothetical protein